MAHFEAENKSYQMIASACENLLFLGFVLQLKRLGKRQKCTPTHLVSVWGHRGAETNVKGGSSPTSDGTYEIIQVVGVTIRSKTGATRDRLEMFPKGNCP